METTRKLSSGNYEGTVVLKAYLIVLKTFCNVSYLFPFTAFLGAVLTFANMNSRLEVIAFKSIGISSKQILKSMLFVTALVGIFYLFVIDFLASVAVSKANDLENEMHKKETYTALTITNSGIWFKDFNETNNYIIYASSFNSEKQNFDKVNFFIFDRDKNFKGSISASKGEIRQGFWEISDAMITNSDGTQEHKESTSIKTALTFNRINKMTTNPKSISFWSIKRYIEMMEKVGLSTARYKMQLYSQIATILQMLALVMLASVFSMNYTRNVRRFYMQMLIAILLAFPIHFFNNLMVALGSAGRIHIWTATLIPPIFIIVLIANARIYIKER